MAANEFIDMEESNMASEPIAVYGEINTPRVSQPIESFEQQWQRALTVEDFRKRCKRKLQSLYGV